jgi:hypothetical protein
MSKEVSADVSFFRRSKFVPLVLVTRRLDIMVDSWTRYPLLLDDGTRQKREKW